MKNFDSVDLDLNIKDTRLSKCVFYNYESEKLQKYIVKFHSTIVNVFNGTYYVWLVENIDITDKFLATSWYRFLHKIYYSSFRYVNYKNLLFQFDIGIKKSNGTKLNFIWKPPSFIQE